MKRRNLLALLLCAVLLMSLFAGCTADPAPAEAETTAPSGIPSDKGNIGKDDIGDKGGIGGDKGGIQSTTGLNATEQLQLLDDYTTPTAKEHTLMIYMVGSDLENLAPDKYPAASVDLCEMMDGKLDVSKINLVVYTGGARAWELGIPSDSNNLLALTPDGTEFEFAATTQKPANTGDPAVLTDFLTFSYENFPADDYSLILWNHGGGSAMGFGKDLLFNNEGLTLPEMDKALANSPFAQKKLSMIGFDACLMATIETAATFVPYADYLLASEETEPGCGWDYTCLNALNSGSITNLTDALLSTYETSMKQLDWDPDYTLSLMDLSEVENVLSAMDALFVAAGQGLNDGNFSAISKARIAALPFAMDGSTDLLDSIDQIDLGHLASNMSSLYQAEAQSLNGAISQLVRKQVTNMENTSGVSVYFPHHSGSVFNNHSADYMAGKVAVSEEYVRFLHAYIDVLVDDTLDTPWAAAKTPAPQPTHFVLELSDEELKDVGRVYYNVLQQYGEDTYLPILTDCPVEPANQTLFPMDPEVVMVNSDIAAQPKPFLATQLTDTKFVSQLAVLMASEDLLTGRIEPAHIAMTHDGNQLNISSIVARDANDYLHVRNELSLEPWSRIAYYTYPVKPTTQDNVMLPLDQWERENLFDLVGISYDQEFWFETAQLSSLPGNFYMQILVENTKGDVIISAFEALPATTVAVETVETENGVMTFHVYSDHAELASYEGTDTALEIPAQVGGQNVTVIGKEAVSGINSLTQVSLPDTVTTLEERAFHVTPIEQIKFSSQLTYIGDFALSGYTGAELALPGSVTHIGVKAFTGAKFQTVTLPAGLKYISGDAFNFCSQLTAINISGSSNYKSIDGVLFTADGKTLVAAPCSLQSYTVPSGVETIGYGAFSGNWNLTELVLPEGLKTIEAMAFAYCESITNLQLPESLEFIGESAFCTDIGMPKSTTTSTITIGKNVSYIGCDAFSAFQLTAYEVDAENATYSSVNGCLLDAAGTTLFSVPYGLTGSFTVPEGVNNLHWHCLQDCNGITELILPDSVVAIDLGAGIPSGLQKLVIGAGLTYWGNQQECQNIPEIVISEENPNF